MKRPQPLRFEENGKTIIFTTIPLKGDSAHQKYSFAVENDDELTQKLLRCVKSHSVEENYLHLCAKALFEIIKENVFTVLVTTEDFNNLVETFYEEHFVKPLFDIHDRTKPNRPWFRAKLLNGDNGEKISMAGKGRTKQQAKALALQNYFKWYFKKKRKSEKTNVVLS